ncbi:MAG: sugar transferase, partial [Actinomycetota bacterium]
MARGTVRTGRLVREAAKRGLDMSLAVVGMVLAGPLWAVVPLAIKIDDSGPILYRQERWGRNGSLFKLYKFRTMTADSDLSVGIR